jgi:hypothetical protein
MTVAALAGTVTAPNEPAITVAKSSFLNMRLSFGYGKSICG